MDGPDMQDFTRQQKNLEERMRLHEQQTREMIFDLMRSNSGKEKWLSAFYPQTNK